MYKKFLPLVLTTALLTLPLGISEAAAQTQAVQTSAAAAGNIDLKQLSKLLAQIHMVPDDYTRTVQTGGNVEHTYLAKGVHKVKKMELPAAAPMQKYEIYYPQDLCWQTKKYPVVIFVNGTGVLAERYPALFEHLASWGFIAVGNEDPRTGDGKSAEATAVKMLALNDDKQSIFWHKIDTQNFGITGHSQGGAGVLNAITNQPHKDIYRAAIALSPTNEAFAQIAWPYDTAQVHTPILLLAGTKGDFETKLVLPLKNMQEMYAKIPAPKIMARRKNSDHGNMLYAADGYVTAFLRWQLLQDDYASQAFIGKRPELLQNTLYQDTAVDFTEK